MKEMTLEEVKIYVLEHFCEYLPECYQKSTLRVESVVKNNQRLTGISLAGVKISPTIYLENIYEEYLEHKSSLCQILRKKANLFYERMKNGEEIMTLLKKVKTMSKEEIGKHLFLALVQTKNNHALLEHRIHRKFLDLSVLCNYEFSVGKELLSIGLSKMLLDQIQLSEEEAFNLAYKNSCARGILRQDATFYSLVKLEMRLNPELEMPDVHLAYSLDGEYGANIMLNKQFLKMASDRFGGDYYVIPASIYELNTINVNYMTRAYNQYQQKNAAKDQEKEDTRFADSVREKSEASGSIVGNSKIGSVSAKDMTMVEYKQYIYNKISQIPMHPTRAGESISVTISEAGFEAMKNDPEYEAWVLNDLQVGWSQPDKWSGICGSIQLRDNGRWCG